MKNKILSRVIALGIVLLAFILSPSSAKAQLICGTNCSIVNNTGCNIQIRWVYQCVSSTPPTNCAMAGPLTILAGQTLVVPAPAACASCLKCDFIVALLTVNANPVNLVVSGNGPLSNPWNAGFCPGSLGSFTWAGGVVTIQ